MLSRLLSVLFYCRHLAHEGLLLANVVSFFHLTRGLS
jgi:hypothetical protein